MYHGERKIANFKDKLRGTEKILVCACILQISVPANVWNVSYNV